MSAPEQGQRIDQSRLISGRLAMTKSARRERQNNHIPKRGRGKGRIGDDAESSQATQSTQSQVVDPTQVEYINYRDQIHDATDGGYDQQHVPDGGHVQKGEGENVLDADDIAAQTASYITSSTYCTAALV